jgi:Mg-chelatase subunit ChlD
MRSTRILSLALATLAAACTKAPKQSPSSPKDEQAQSAHLTRENVGTEMRASAQEGALGAPGARKVAAAPAASTGTGSTWGTEVGDAYGAGGLGLSGTGEGGGGRGEGLGSIGTIGHGAGTGTGAGFGGGLGRLGGAPAARYGVAGPSGIDVQFQGVKAGEWDDNANYREFQRFLGATVVPFHRMDIRARRFLVVRDMDGKPMPRCTVSVSDERNRSVSFVTTASGRALLFPHAEGLSGKQLAASATCAEGSASASFSLDSDDDGVVDLKLAARRAPLVKRAVDVAFVLDTTGSMSEEIAAVKHTIQRALASLDDRELTVRVGLVEYKDKGDDFVTRTYPMTTDLTALGRRVDGITASGGGDMPEHMTAGLHAALTELRWSRDAVARLAFVIADAPPHLDYQDGVEYTEETKNAAHKGIQLFTVAASGMDELGQVVFRQMAQYTGGTEMFVLRGGAGHQSVGGGDPKRSCGGTHENYASGNLHELVVQKIKRELANVDGDPMQIAGLKTDENAKPCEQRLVFAQ